MVFAKILGKSRNLNVLSMVDVDLSEKNNAEIRVKMC